MSNDFQNDAIISFLLNKFPVNSSNKSTNSERIEKFEEFEEFEKLNKLSSDKKDDKTYLKRIFDFLKMYWFLLFVFLIILLFVFWKKYLKKN
jgi:hypothetical protein